MILTSIRRYFVVGAVAVAAVSGAGNLALWYKYRAAVAHTETIVQQVQTEAAEAANKRLIQVTIRQQLAAEAREQQLLGYLVTANEVAELADARAEAAAERLDEWQGSLVEREVTDPTYADWARAELPPSVSEGLRAMQ